MNELITLEINSKNKQKLIDLLNENNLVVEYMNIEQTYTVAGRDEDERINPQPRVLASKSEQGIAAAKSWDKQTTLEGFHPFNYNISETT